MERISRIGPALESKRSAALSPAADDLTTPLGALVSRPPLVVSPAAPVSEVARAMRAAGSSSALVDGEPPGIVTDRDLSGRVLAEGLSPETPARAVMSAPLETFPADTPLFEALGRVLELNLHHLPVTRDGRIVGIVSDTELLRHQARSPLPLIDRIERLERTSDAPADYSREVARIAETLFEGGLGVVQIGRVLATVGAALTGRLLALAEHELGPPPCPYAWVVLGSEGRMEQVLLSDQDNALVYRDDTDAARDYFSALAAPVVEGLIRAGFPRCPGGYMATNWCRPLAEWETLFRQWVERPEPQALLEAQVFLDFRAVHGDLSLESLERILLRGGRRELFLHHMARAALGFQPPIGAFGRIRARDGAVDLKAGGIAATVMLARVYALAAGASPRPTLERLEAAAGAGTLSRSGAEILGESFRFLTRLRLQHQLSALRSGEALTNRVRLDGLSALERRRLKEALQAVRRLQEATQLRFPG